MVRQRHANQSVTSDQESKGDTPYLDESEQEQVVQRLQQESASQQRQIDFALVALCRLVALLSIAWGFLIQLETSSGASPLPIRTDIAAFRWVHITLSSILCWFTPEWIGRFSVRDSVGKAPSTTDAAVTLHEQKSQQGVKLWSILFFASILVAAVGLLQSRSRGAGSRRNSLDITMHYGLSTLNLITMGLAFMAHFEQKRTDKLLQDLTASKYRCKSL